MAKIAFFEIEEWEADYLKARLSGNDLVFFTNTRLDESTVAKAKDADIVAVFVNSFVTPELLQNFSNLKFIAAMSTGFDHINLLECKNKGVTVSNVPTYGENTVAEHAFALLLNISRKIYDSVERTRRGNWNLDGLRGFDLRGKTCGIIGTGRIGKNFAHYAAAFGMRVVAFDKFPNQEWARECSATYLPLEQLLAESDVISIHLPYMPETHHTINLTNYKKIKKGCVLINTARGGLVETEALLRGLEEGIFKAIGLDVLEEEPIVKDDKVVLTKIYQKQWDYKTALADHILVEQDNVYLTPHNAFNSPEALMRILDTTVENVKGFLEGKPVNVVK